jgi:hypothetical protein
MKACPDCSYPLCEYDEEVCLEWICWNCGYYTSNSPTDQKLFENMVRESPTHFIRKYFKSTKNNRRVDRTLLTRKLINKMPF